VVKLEQIVNEDISERLAELQKKVASQNFEILVERESRKSIEIELAKLRTRIEELETRELNRPKRNSELEITSQIKGNIMAEVRTKIGKYG
jgi:septal ring factor EnvC (AmiA/AmiB activator)